MHSVFASTRRVVVTGLGVVSPVGCNTQEFWAALMARRNGVTQTGDSGSGRETGDLWAGRCPFTGHIDDFGELPKATRKTVRKSLKLMNRETQLGVAAGQQAIRDSGFLDTDIDRERVGVCFGAGNVSMLPADFLAGVDACSTEEGFDLSRWGEDGLPQVEPLWLLRCLPNMPSCHLAIINDLRGLNNCITQREAAANLAVAEAARAIQDDEADAVVVGGTGTLLQPVNQLHQLLEQGASDTEQSRRVDCRPFDAARGAMVPAEGAGAIILEEYGAAMRRGARIYGEYAGGGASCVIDRNGQPDARAAIRNAIRAVLNDASATVDDINQIHAHGLGTRRADRDEALAIHDALEAQADAVPVTTVKGNMGNPGAGGGAIELVAGLLALQHGRLFPVCNTSALDPECPVRLVTSDDVPAGDAFISLNVHHRGLASGVMIRRAA